MPSDRIKNYLTSKAGSPYFLFVGDGQYRAVIDEVQIRGLELLPLSGFCAGADKVPDLDELLDEIESSDPAAAGKRLAVTGLGEFLALCGAAEAKRTLSRLKNARLGSKKVVLILRGLLSQLADLTSDPRFDSHRYSVIDRGECNLSFTHMSSPQSLSSEPGVKSLLQALEAGASGNLIFASTVHFEHSLFTIHHIADAYEGIRFFARDFSLPRTLGTDAQWTALLSELRDASDSLDAVFEAYGFSQFDPSDFYPAIAGHSHQSWICFLYLNHERNRLENRYLKLVLERTSCFEDFPCSLLDTIIDIPHTDPNFSRFCEERRKLLEKVPESDTASFVVNNRRVISESIYKLTDRTKAEREEVIAWITDNGLPSELETIYPALVAYLKKYTFKCRDLAELLTDYFDSYKRQKVLNRLEPAFLEQVDALALQRCFNRLPTRNDILERLEKEETFLYWVDALGVEYLSLIDFLAQEKGLAISVSIARAELPTITSMNRDFFDSWPGQKRKNGDLDDIKHHENGGYNFENNQLPIHLAAELKVITEVMERAAAELAYRRCKRFLIVSDHGASRLAVLRRKEEKYDSDTPGKHSGRCCKAFAPCDLPFAAEENGYLVLADYGRFKGSRRANVEVHGGATLEEAVIPIIELSLSDSSILVQLAEEEVVADFRTGTEITLFLNAAVKNVSLLRNGTSYPARQVDENHYHVSLPDIKRAGCYPADVYAGDKLIGKVAIHVQGKSAKVNDAFDELF